MREMRAGQATHDAVSLMYLSISIASLAHWPPLASAAASLPHAFVYTHTHAHDDAASL